MKKILTEKQATLKAKEIREKGLKIVLVGGCFDLLHVGHIRFLKEAKEKGVVFVLLESDRAVKKLKGENRPVNKIEERAETLVSISFVDYVVLLKGIKKSKDYAKIVFQIKPDFIAITKGDNFKNLKEKQAKNINAQILEVTKVKDKSSTNFAKLS